MKKNGPFKLTEMCVQPVIGDPVADESLDPVAHASFNEKDPGKKAIFAPLEPSEIEKHKRSFARIFFQSWRTILRQRKRTSRTTPKNRTSRRRQ